MSDYLAIDIWSDIACPWCWVGKRNLEEALASYEGDVAVAWHAFELNPEAPKQAPEQVDYAARLAAKYGTDRSAARQMVEKIVNAGRTAGLELRFDRIRPSNTFDAHRLMSWAQEEGRGTVLKERLFKAYFEEGRAVSDHDELVRLAGEVDLDTDKARQVLESDVFGRLVRSEEEAAGDMGVSGVPFFVFGRQFAVAGAQPAEVLLEAMQRAANGGATEN